MGIMLQLIRLSMFQNSYTFAQIMFYFFLKGPGEACYFKSRRYAVFIQLGMAIAMFVLNAWVTVPLYTLCAITMHHKTPEGKRDKRYRNLSHRIENLLAGHKQSLLPAVGQDQALIERSGTAFRAALSVM